ncbi:hypothetical protein WOA01_21560 [Methylocystis sp. IM2]|uniref:hypothetical protein n=1 Tax=Methylocystis sp. IM2 TaxID=3136563 RepID=UPI0030FC35F9
MAYRGFFGPEPSVATPVSIKEPGAVVIATPEPAAVVRQAWRQVSVILTIASAMAIGICLLAGAVIAHTLAPTERVVGGFVASRMATTGIECKSTRKENSD